MLVITLFFILFQIFFIKIKAISEINIIIKGNETQRILNDAFEHIPSQILVNGDKINETKYLIDNLTSNINNITLVWNYTLTNCSYMFRNLVNITEINFIDFDTSQVVNMNFMFSSCISLTKLNLTTFDTSSVKNMSCMFYNCTNLRYLDISTFNTSSVEDMSYMFSSLKKINSLDLTHFNTSSVQKMNRMFLNMENLYSLEISSFDTSKVIDMNYLFGYTKLQSLDLTNFNTTSVRNMAGMFYNTYLTSIDLSNFDTSSVTDISYIFHWCRNLTSLNLSNFNTSSLTIMSGMFYSCERITSLDLSNFNTDKVTLMTEIFIYCKSLITLNIDNFNFSIVESINEMFSYCDSLISLDLHNLFLTNQYKFYYGTHVIYKMSNKNITFCLGNEGNFGGNNTFIFEELSNYKNNCSDICFMPNKKIIPSISKCTMDCKTEDIYKYEYNNTCYKSCPNGTYYSYDNNYLCILGSEDKPEIKSFSDFYSICKANELNDENKTKDEIIENLRNELIRGNFDILISKYIENEKKDFLVNDTDNNILYQFTSTYNQNNNYNISNNIGNNYSKIKLDGCESLLRIKNDLKDDNIIIIFKVDIFEQGLLIPIIEYEIYNPKNRQILELDICNGTKIKLEIPAIMGEEEFKYNPLDDYYNDFCFSYTTKNKTDIILNDRRNEFITNNMSLCEKDCEYKGYDYINKRSLCECYVKIKFPLISEIAINKDKLLSNFLELRKITNIEVMKCYKTLFTSKGIKKNIAFYTILFIIVISIILTILFKIYGYKKFNEKIDEIIKIKIKKESDNSGINNNENIDVKNNVNNNTIIVKKNTKKIKIKKKVKIKIKIKKRISKDYNSARKLQLYDTKLPLDHNKNLSNNNVINNNIITLNDDKYDIFLMNKYNDYEINNLEFEEALKIDKRTFAQYYFSLIKTKHVLIFTFYTSSDYNSRIIKIILFLFSFALYYTVNGLFFSDATMHKIYEEQGDFNFIYQIPQILYSTIISSLINVIVKLLSLTEKNILEIKNEKKNLDEKISKTLKCLLIKFVLFFEFVFVFLLLFWYFLSCFGAVYINTQIHLFKDTMISYLLSLIYPFGLNFIPCLVRIQALKPPNNKKKKIMYQISTYLQLL